jgi:hypothetical protein
MIGKSFMASPVLTVGAHEGECYWTKVTQGTERRGDRLRRS